MHKTTNDCRIILNIGLSISGSNPVKKKAKKPIIIVKNVLIVNGCILNFTSKNKNDTKLNSNKEIAVARAAPTIP